MIYSCKPKKVQIYVNAKKKTAAQVKAETGCDAIINGGLYNMNTFKPLCHLKVDGKVLGKDQYKYFGYGWDADGLPTLALDYDKLDNYICCVCMVRDGKAEKMYYDANVGRSCARTAIGTFPDGRLWLYADKAYKTPVQLQEIALKAGVKDAVMLDGGGSTQGIFPDCKVTSSRKVHNYICVWEDDSLICPHCGGAVIVRD